MNPPCTAPAQDIQGEHLFKFKGKIVSAAPAAMLASVSVVALTLTPVHAEEISTVLATPQTFATDFDHSLTATGAINIIDSDTAALTIDTDYSSTFINDGTISLTGDASTATGLFLSSNLIAGGEVINNGTIFIDVEESSPDSVYGIYVNNDVAGTINNTGTIDAYALGTDTTAVIVGIHVSGEVSATGQIRNSGTITVAGEQTDTHMAEAFGIEVDGEFHGLINNSNSGTIKATATSTENDASAYGILVDDAIGETGRILNSGTITAMATVTTPGGEDAIASGIKVDGVLDGLINNSGTIKAISKNNYAYSFGILVDDAMGETGRILNSGTITAVATSTNRRTASASGIYVAGEMAGLINNTGTIEVEATKQLDESHSHEPIVGIHLQGELTGSVLNSGTIKVVSDIETASAYAMGIRINDDVAAGAVISNSGTIDSSANSLDKEVNAYGLELHRSSAGDVTNAGIINATATNAGSSDAKAYGVYISDMTGTFANSGTITATATNTGIADAKAYGLYVDDMNGEIADLGTISVSGADRAYAVYLNEGTGTMQVNTNDSISGLMRVEDHDVEMLASGGSNIFYFEDANTGAGAFNTSVSDRTSAWFVDDEGGSMPIYAAVSTGELNVSGNAIASFGRQLDVFSGQFDADAGVNCNAKAISLLQGSAMGTLRPFASVGAQRFDYDARATTQDLSLNVGNVTFGMAGTMGNCMDLAFGLGVLSAAGKSGITDYDVSAYYLGGSVGTTFGGFDLDAGLGFGMLNTEKTRTFNSTNLATAAFDSNFTTVHLGAQRTFQMRSGLNLTGFGQVRYTRQDDDSYAETGSAAAATVGARAVEVTEVSLGVKASKELSNGGVLSSSLSAMSRQFSGDVNTAVTMFGQTANILDANANFEGIIFGIGYQNQIIDGAVLNLSLDLDLGSEGNDANLAAGLTWSF